MTNFLKWGAEWLSEMTKVSTDEPVEIGYHETGFKSSSASFVDESGRLVPGPVAVRTEHTKFLFESSELARLGIAIKRGLLIKWNSNYYEVVQDGNKWWNYNDTFKRKIVIATKHVTNTTS